jgi:hypothetical protein
MSTSRCVALALLLMVLAAPARGQIGEYVKINGYGSLEFEKQVGANGRGDANGSFDADGFDLVLNATPTQRLRVAVDLTWEHGAATENGRGNVAVEYAIVELFVRDWLKLRGGKMFTPFGLYNEIHTAKPLFLSVKEPFSTDKTDKLGSPVRFFPRWGAGLAVLGNVPLGGKDLDYVVQLANGDQSDGNPFEADDNVQKAVAARVRFHPSSRIAVGTSLYSDRITERSSAGADTGKRTEQLSFGVHGTWEDPHLGVELAYLWGTLDPSGPARLSRHGLELMAWGKVKERYRPYLRYERHEPDADTSDDRAELLLGGLNVRLEHGLFLKAELDRFTSGARNSKLKGSDYTEFKASLSVGF